MGFKQSYVMYIVKVYTYADESFNIAAGLDNGETGVITGISVK